MLIPRTAVSILCGLSLAGVARAHIVPIDPSLCRFDAVSLALPATGATGSAAAATPADDFRIVYDTGTNQAIFCPNDANVAGRCTTPAARPFSLGPIAGSITFPASFPARMTSAGDLAVGTLPVTLVANGDAATVPLPLTTALVAWSAPGAPGHVEEGAPIAGFGALTFVGVASSGLPGPLASAAPLLVRMTCTLAPNPDKDQFVLPARVVSIGGKLASTKGTLRMVVDLASGQTTDLLARPTLLRASIAGQPIVAAAVSTLTQRKKQFVGTADDGQARLVVARRFPTRHILTLSGAPISLAGLTPGAPVVVAATVDLGGVLARGERLFRVSKNGQRLTPAK